MNHDRDASVSDQHVSHGQVERRVRFVQFYDTTQYRISVTSLKQVKQRTGWSKLHFDETLQTTGMAE